MGKDSCPAVLHATCSYVSPHMHVGHAGLSSLFQNTSKVYSSLDPVAPIRSSLIQKFMNCVQTGKPFAPEEAEMGVRVGIFFVASPPEQICVCSRS